MSDDILFKIGFESHQEAKGSLEELAKAVESLQAKLKSLGLTEKNTFAVAIDAAKTLNSERAKAQREAEAAAKKAVREAEKEAKAKEALDKKTAKDQADIAKKIEADRRRSEAEQKRQAVEQREQARLTAFEWAASYEEQMLASDKARQAINANYRSMFERANDVAEGIGRLARGVVLLGLAEGESMQKVVQNLALVQSAFDLVLGAGKVLKGIYGAYQALNAIKGLTVIATAAEAKATDIANSSSVRYTEAMLAEIMTTRELARMKGVLTAANAGVAASSVAAAGASGAAGAAGGAASSAAAGAAAGGLIASAKTMAVAFVGYIKSLAGSLVAGVTAVSLGVAAAATAAILSPFVLKLKAERQQAEDSLKKADAMQQKLDASRRKAAAEADAKAKISDMRNQFGDVELQGRIDLARTPMDQLSIIQDERLRREQAVMDARAKAQDFLTVNNEGKLDLGADPSGEGARAIEILQKETERYIEILGREQSKVKEVNDEHKKSVMEQIQGVEDVMRAREQERKEIESSFMSAKERFGMMNAADQASALAALERARTMQAGTIDEETMGKLQQVGTDEAQRLVRANALARADAAGFTQRAGGDTASRIAAIDAEQATDVGELSRLSGQRDTDLASRARGPQVEIVDRTQIDVQMRMQEDQLFNRIFGMVTDANSQLMQRLEARINAEMRQSLEDKAKDSSYATQQKTAD
jgi:hypothetical protein